MLSAKLLLLLFPGIIASNLYGDFTINSTKRSEFRFIVDSIIFGFASYLTNQIIYSFYQFGSNVNISWDNVQTLDSLKYIVSENSIPYLEIIFSCFTSILLSLLFSYISNNKLLHRAAHKIKITRGYGTATLYSQYLHDLGWVCVRNLETNYTYFGRIKYHSDFEGFKEIVLYDVTVHRPNKLSYDIKSIYISTNISNLTIEQVNKKQT